MTQMYDVIIAGGGTMGLATALALSKRGLRTLVLEQYDVPHDLGSHGGRTRIFRHAYAEGASYVPLMSRSEELWDELQEDAGAEFVHRTGILEMDGPGGNTARGARVSAAEHDIPYEWLEAAEIRTRWPQFAIPDGWEGGYSDRAGFLEVSPALTSMRSRVEGHGATFRAGEPVTSWGAEPGKGVRVDTAHDRYVGERLVLTGGAWMSELAAGAGLPLTVVRKVVFWLRVTDPAWFQVGAFPVFAAVTGSQAIYGFPLHGHSGLKVADHLGGEPASPESVDRYVDVSEADDLIGTATAYLPGLTGDVLDSCVCLYTRTPDEHFIVDRHPEYEQVVIAAGFSGHGFKFAPAIGEHIANLCEHSDSGAFEVFSLSRFQRV